VSATGCPPREGLDALLDLRLDAAEEALLRAHARHCPSCREGLRELSPSWLFTAVDRPPLPDEAWGEVLAAVRREVARSPRPRSPWRRLVARLEAMAEAPGLAALRHAAPATLGALALVALSAALVSRSPSPVERLAKRVDKREEGFVYLSNPDARVTHVVLAGPEGDPPIQLTMVVDDRLADFF
jgi:hypothetical protein